MTSVTTSPLAGDVHVNTPLTNFGQQYIMDPNSFIAHRAMPNLPVSKQSDLYYTFDRDDWQRDEVKERADGTESAGSGFELSTDPYFCRVYAFHKDISDRQRANQDVQINLDRSATRFALQKMMIRRERIFANTYLTAANWASGHSDATQNWASGGNPIVAVRNAKRQVQEQTGSIPNKVVIDRVAYDTLMDHDEILGRIEGGSTTNLPAQVRRELLAQLFEVDQIFVMESSYTNSVKGASTTARDFISSENMLLYYAPDNIGLEEPTAGAQFSWTGYTGATESGMRIKRFRMEHLNSDRVEAEMAFDYRVTGNELGYLFTGVAS